MRINLNALASAVFEATEALSDAERISFSCESCIDEDFDEQKRSLNATFYNLCAAQETREVTIQKLIFLVELAIENDQFQEVQAAEELIEELKKNTTLPEVDPTEGQKGPYR
jgi:hypothetical protein